MQGFIILAIIGTEKLIVTNLTDGWTEIRTPISHPAISRCYKHYTYEGANGFL